MSWLPVLPIAIPAATAVAAVLAGRSRGTRRWIGVGGSAALLAVSIALVVRVWNHGIQVAQAGDWAAPFGISLVADHLSVAMVAITGIIGLAGALYAAGSLDEEREAFGFYPLYHILMMGICGAFLTGDLFNLYVWFEVMLIASFALLVHGNDPGQLKGTAKYAVINLIASFALLAAVGLIYGLTGTLNFADLSIRLAEIETPGLVVAMAALFLVSFGIKAALFPLFFALPASYHFPPIAVSAVFAGLLTKVGVYALFRVFTLLFTQSVEYTHTILLVVAGLTMLTGVLGAAAQEEVRRILSFHIISQVGYMVMGLALFTPLAVAGGIFYIIHHIIVKANLFFVGGLMHRLGGSYKLQDLGGLYRARPILAILFIIPAFSLAGFPPLSGFWAKLIVIRAGLEIDQFLIVVVALVVGLLTLFSMSKIWNGAFWEALPADREAAFPVGRNRALMVAPVVGLAALTLTIGLWATPLFEFSQRAAVELLDRSIYVEAVLGPLEPAAAEARGWSGEGAWTGVGSDSPGEAQTGEAGIGGMP